MVLRPLLPLALATGLFAIHASGQAANILPETPKGALTSAAEAEKQAEAIPLAAPAPASLRWWNRDIATLRSTAEGLTPDARAAAAVKRLDESVRVSVL